MQKQTSKYTPGPWRVSGRGIMAKTRSICIQAIGDDTCKANGYLISAAPEMLEALKTVVAETDDAVWISKFNLIIAKAEGRIK